jgi:predicted RNase H-like nuclease
VPIVQDTRAQQALAVIDVPIGLSYGERRCDRLARRLLGSPRAASVFRPPCREALTASTYAEANAINRDLCAGIGISQQAFQIRERIKAVDDLVQPDDQRFFVEAHPEVVFAVINGGRGLDEPKHSAEGAAIRLALLRQHGVPAFDPTEERRRFGTDVDDDDIVDAAAMLLTAKHIADESAGRLPPKGHERDARGLAMEMWTPTMKVANRAYAGTT